MSEVRPASVETPVATAATVTGRAARKQRGREWLATLLVMAMLASLCTAFASFILQRTATRPGRQLPPGQTWVADGGESFTLIDVRALPSILDPVESKMKPAPKGSMYVIATFNVEGLHEKSYCRFYLMATGNRFWETADDIPGNAPVSYCDDDMIAAGHGQFVQVYIVPSTTVPDIVGLQKDSEMRLTPLPILVPPRG